MPPDLARAAAGRDHSAVDLPAVPQEVPLAARPGGAGVVSVDSEAVLADVDSYITFMSKVDLNYCAHPCNIIFISLTTFIKCIYKHLIDM